MRHMKLTSHFAVATVAAAALGLWAATPAVGVDAAARQPIERLEATSVNMSNVGRPGADRLEIVIERWSSERERDELIATLRDKGSDALLSALQKIPRVGFIRRTAGGLGWDLHFARERKLEDGGRQIVIATDRPMSFREARNRPRSADYEFTLADIRFDGDGKGVGKLSVASRISVKKDTGVIEIEDFGTQPVQLTDVRSTRTPRS